MEFEVRNRLNGKNHLKTKTEFLHWAMVDLRMLVALKSNTNIN